MDNEMPWMPSEVGELFILDAPHYCGGRMRQLMKVTKCDGAQWVAENCTAMLEDLDAGYLPPLVYLEDYQRGST